MEGYLQRFYEKLKEKYGGSLVRVEDVRLIEPNAKEYLSRLAREGFIERVRWGWYWIPDEIKDPWEFFEKDKNFKVISCQTAATLWNLGFMNVGTFVVRVADKSYGKALEEFFKKRGWRIWVEVVPKPTSYVKLDGLLVESLDETIIECVQRWAFMDAFAALYVNRDKIDLKTLLKKAYWRRIKGTNVRVKQAIEYGCHLINKLTGKNMFNVRKMEIKDEYLKGWIKEAVEKVVELA